MCQYFEHNGSISNCYDTYKIILSGSEKTLLCVLCGVKTRYDKYCSENGSYDSLKVKPKNGLSFKSPSNGQVIKIDDEHRWKIEEGF